MYEYVLGHISLNSKLHWPVASALAPSGRLPMVVLKSSLCERTTSSLGTPAQPPHCRLLPGELLVTIVATLPGVSAFLLSPYWPCRHGEMGLYPNPVLYFSLWTCVSKVSIARRSFACLQLLSNPLPHPQGHRRHDSTPSLLPTRL